jgi:AraC family transcriptional regulator, transcriptional activator of the genes for pyochelin and ferripyochelin receptors
MSTVTTDTTVHGLRLVHSVSSFASPTRGRGASDVDMVRLHFALRGEYAVRYPTLDRSYERLPAHCSLFYAQPFELEFDCRSTQLETFGIQFPVQRFIAYADGASPGVSRFCEQIAGGKPGFLFEPAASLAAALTPSVRRLLDSRYDGPTQALFLYSQSLELLVRALDLAADGGSASHPKRPTRSDRERLFAARDFLEARITEPPALAEVARKVGLNEYKLKHGFKQLFGTTVHAYLTDKRLEHARSLLLDSDRTAAEVAFALGYSSPQHFHQAFKQRFGVAPKAMRKTS